MLEPRNFRQQLILQKQKVMIESPYTEAQQQYDNFMKEMLNAVSSGNIEKYRFLFQMNQQAKYDVDEYFLRKYQTTPAHIVCENNRITVLEYMLEKKQIKINSTLHEDGNTLLHQLVINYCVNLNKTNQGFKLLIQHGANPLIRNKYGETIFDYIQRKHKQSETLDYVKKVYLETLSQKSIEMAQELFISQDPLLNQLSELQYMELLEYLK